MHQMKYLWYFVALFCVVELINLLSGRVLNYFGILPRSINHIGFIFTSPFLHVNTAHFLSNITTLSVFSLLFMQFVHKNSLSAAQNARRFFMLTFILIGLTGLCVWLFARPAYHLGASGLVYANFGFILLAGWLQKRLSLFFISIVVAVLYGIIIWGAFPSEHYISWESHLFGFMVGLFLAWTMKKLKSY